MDLARHQVRRAGGNVALGPTEFRLLRSSWRSAPRLLAQAAVDLVWGRDKEIEIRTVDVHVRRLRQALGAGELELIRTVRQAGYALDDEAA